MRREEVITLDDRGKELRFRIREMSALQLERFTFRLAGLLAPALGMDEESLSLGFLAGEGDVPTAAFLKALGKLDQEKLGPLLDEMLTCAKRIEGSAELDVTAATLDGYVEDVRTLWALRWHILKLLYSFLAAGDGSPSVSPPTGPIADTVTRLARVSRNSPT
jgi:hypothetical protein